MAAASDHPMAPENRVPQVTAVPSEPHNDPRLSGSLDSGHRDWIFPAAAPGRGRVFV